MKKSPSNTGMMQKYEWPRPPGINPFTHQITTAQFLVSNPKAFCFNEQGTGKTASVIWASDFLMKLGAIRRVLIICPLSIMHSAWQQDLFKFALHRRVTVAYGSAKKRKALVQNDADYVVINFDGVQICKQEIIDAKFDLVVVDEASAYKNTQTARWKALRDIMKHANGLWMLTGTPAAQSPADAYGLAKLVNPANVPAFFGQFRDMVMFPVTQYKWNPKPGHQAIVHNALQPAIRFAKKDCLDLPPVTVLDREVAMTPQQAKYYKKLMSELLVEAAGEEISAVNAAVKLNKLLQIACGSVYADTGEVIDFDASNRMTALIEAVEEAANKVLIFVPYSHAIEQVKAHLTKHGITCDVINGAVSVSRRSELVKQFQEQVNPRVLILQPQAASHGLTLTAADTIIWFAPVSSVETYLQANARIDRPGQKNAMTIVHIKGSPVESIVYRALRGNIDTHQQITSMYQEVLSAAETT